MKLTKKRKRDWLSALKSGNYKQGTGQLKSEGGSYCCLGVLACVLKKPINSTGTSVIGEKSSGNGFDFFYKILGGEITNMLWKANDGLPLGYKRDYSNVIPLIEKIKAR